MAGAVLADEGRPAGAGDLLCVQVSGKIWRAERPASRPADRAEAGPVGSRIVRVETGADGPRVGVLTKEFAAACQPDVSFDAKRFVFAGKKRAGDRWDIWEMSVEGGPARRITSDLGDCTRPRYLSRQYTLAKVGTNLRELFGFVSSAGEAAATSLHIRDRDESGGGGITYGLGDDADPFVLDDGRLLYATRQPGGRVALLAVNNDGTDCELFVPAETGLPVKAMPCQSSSGFVVFVESQERRPDGGGRLGAVTMRRNLHSYRVLAEATDGVYRSPGRLPDGRLLVSYRSREADSSYGVYTLDPRDGTRSGPVFDTPEWHEVDAVAVAARRRPDGRSSVVKAGGETGWLYCLDATLSRPSDGKRLERGTVRRVRLIERAAADPSVTKRVLGEAPVETDGSFHVEVPAEVPISLQLLDADGAVRRTQRSSFWVMPGERRGCIGCHEDRELVPENRLVEAVTRPATKLTAPPMK